MKKIFSIIWLPFEIIMYFMGALVKFLLMIPLAFFGALALIFKKGGK